MSPNYEMVVKHIRQQLTNYIIDNNLKSLVLGVSGGIDSAIVAVLADKVCYELNIPLIGRTITIESNTPEEISRAELVGESLCTIYDSTNMDMVYGVLSNELVLDGEKDDIAYKIRQGNIKARLRMINLYNLASANKGMVLGTENKSEENIGFFTIGGDEISDFEPIKELWKTEVYELSDWLCDNEFKIDAPHSVYDKRGVALMACINADATDGLGISNTDINQILPGFIGTSREGYKEVDKILQKWIYNGSGDINNPVIQRHIKSEFKRKRPFIVKIIDKN